MMSTGDYVHIDIESRSRCDLKAHGAYNYARDPSTIILFISWAVGDEDPHLWDWRDPFPTVLMALFHNPDVIFKAHNAAFERLMFEYVLHRQVGTPIIPISRFYCTAVQARANALPDKLELCARALGAREQKDHRGMALIRALSVPDKESDLFCENDTLLREFGQYCKQDVRTERAISETMRELTPAEREDYVVSEEINDRGLMVDVEFAKVVVGYSEAEKALLKNRVVQLTKGEVPSCGSPKFPIWIHARLEDKHKGLVESTSNKCGFCFDASRVAHLYEVINDLSPEVQEGLKIRAMASKTSVSKFKAMVNRADDCDRVCGALILYGAGQTHRYASRGLQLHNLPRDTAPDPFTIRDQFIDGTVDKDDLFALLKSMIRPSIMPADGKMLVCIDWSSIEAIVLPWSTDDPRAYEYMGVFRRKEDVYVQEATKVGVSRQVGKVVVLSMGYGGGVGAFQSMAKNYGVSMPDEEANAIKVAWRRANPWAPDWWKALEAAAKQAMRDPGVIYAVGRVQYVYLGSGRQLPGNLWCILPSGTMLCYPQARLVYDDDWGQFEIHCIKSSLRPKADDPQWPRMKLWGGLMSENITQAIAGDLLREALIRVREWSDEVVLHVHDEIVMEVPEADAEDVYADLHDEMLVVPSWATGMPLACEGWIGDYYRK